MRHNIVTTKHYHRQGICVLSQKIHGEHETAIDITYKEKRGF